MSVVKINALEIPEGRGDELVGRFLPRLEELSTVDGFEGFELLRPTGGEETRWFVYSRWESEEAYQAWRTGDVFARGHAGPGGPGGPGGGHGGETGGERPQPVAMGSSLLEFEVAAVAGPAEG
ncbi:MAG: antibiotic biosynthesis monooxygenase [Actinomycetota bacterium]